MKRSTILLAAAVLAIGLAGFDKSAQANDDRFFFTEEKGAVVGCLEGIGIGVRDDLQKYYKEDHDCEFDHSEYGDYHDDPRYDRGEYDDDCFED